MTNCAIVVQARMSSSRLPGKSLAPIGEKPLLYYVVKHLQHSQFPVIVATSDHKSDDILVDFLKIENFRFFRGDLHNVYKRYLDCAEAYGLEAVIRVTGDNPFVDLLALQENEHLLNNYDYLDGIYPNGWIKGSGFEFFKLKAFQGIDVHSESHKEHVTLALREMIGKREGFQKMPIPGHQKYQKEIALTCDYPQDLELLRFIFKSLNYSTAVDIHQIISLYKSCPLEFRKSASLHYSNRKDTTS